MTGLLLFVHVLGAILAIGPVAIAASMFPPAARAAHAEAGHPASGGVPGALHRITRVYAVVGIIVPVSGAVAAVALDVLGDLWLQVSVALAAAAAVLLVWGILPAQRRLLPGRPQHVSAPAAPGDVDRSARRLAMYTGMFNLLWVVVVVLMVYRPGSAAGS